MIRYDMICLYYIPAVSPLYHLLILPRSGHALAAPQVLQADSDADADILSASDSPASAVGRPESLGVPPRCQVVNMYCTPSNWGSLPPWDGPRGPSHWG